MATITDKGEDTTIITAMRADDVQQIIITREQARAWIDDVDNAVIDGLDDALDLAQAAAEDRTPAVVIIVIQG